VISTLTLVCLLFLGKFVEYVNMSKRYDDE